MTRLFAVGLAAVLALAISAGNAAAHAQVRSIRFSFSVGFLAVPCAFHTATVTLTAVRDEAAFHRVVRLLPRALPPDTHHRRLPDTGDIVLSLRLADGTAHVWQGTIPRSLNAATRVLVTRLPPCWRSVAG